ncbi:tRNA (N6-threonylcarbamoyladenosine(37)-N6)-methyltransferase TrmO [Amaricoccus solimangrovi]|uniref:tRNA (N6-threonylcarbamoyladenosine(37)-N6)-methyltransferase TrmO n=1 Tax=Amaricoccus solimangrovi TaxID=2589815 RepID=A0A501WZK7_9RHOB|nr:tRNA (N6-threonylcarbamoyladenosine(37)-N6)-methyltransferase TrmO [Amaricoccus solimangrovi]TPE52541.1 tRNA (N6-threonylcarbamoyladenosine(37)-N6)-methyltransferase TrmO [Amaricoccus solimangrovi]
MSGAARPGETLAEGPFARDAWLTFIGRLRTPWTTRGDCPRQGSLDGPECRVEVFPRWQPALEGLERFGEIELLYWMDQASRDLLTQCPAHLPEPRGTFALRSPARPNPIATSRVRLVGVAGRVLTVRGLDCLDGTALLDIKPDRCAFSRKG